MKDNSGEPGGFGCLFAVIINDYSFVLHMGKTAWPLHSFRVRRLSAKYLIFRTKIWFVDHQKNRPLLPAVVRPTTVSVHHSLILSRGPAGVRMAFCFRGGPSAMTAFVPAPHPQINRGFLSWLFALRRLHAGTWVISVCRPNPALRRIDQHPLTLARLGQTWHHSPVRECLSFSPNICEKTHYPHST